MLYKFASECRSQTVPHLWSRDRQEKFLAPSADNNKTCNYDTEYSNHNPSHQH